MSFVIDASMTVAWLFTDERTRAPQGDPASRGGRGAVVPSLWHLEVANVLRNALRQKRCDTGYVARCPQRLGRLQIAVDPETHIQTWSRTRQLSIEHDLTIYDASYLELTLRRRRPLTSCDAALIKAGQKDGLDVLGY